MTQLGGHLHRAPGVHYGSRVLWLDLVCAGCGCGFTANGYSVPVLGNPDTGGGPACRGCWRRLNLMRRQANMPEWDTPPDAYPGANPDEVRDVIAPAKHPGLHLPGII